MMLKCPPFRPLEPSAWHMPSGPATVKDPGTACLHTIGGRLSDWIAETRVRAGFLQELRGAVNRSSAC